MRQSYYPQQQQQQQPQYDTNYSQQNRSSQQQPPLTGAAARLANKQKELQGLKLLREHSKNMADDIERLADQVDILVKGGDSVADVLSGWQGVFRAIQIARADPTLLNPSQDSTNQSSTGDDGKDKEEEKRRVLPETLVRIPIEGDAARQ